MMKKEIGFVCIGQAGGNVGKLFETLGYSVLYINTSQEDLDTLKDATQVYHIPGGEGCYKNRDAAKKLLAKNLDDVITVIKSKMTAKFLFFIFAAGGGTGSGMTPSLMDILVNEEFFDDNDMPTKVVGCIPIIPDSNETPIAKLNAYECFSEIASIENLGNIYPLNNELPATYNGGYDKYKLHVNRKFVEMFDTFINIPSKHKSASGNIDRAEIKELLSTYGMAVISITDKKASMAKIIESLKSGIFAPIDVNAETRTLKYVASSTIEPLNYEAIKLEFGQFLDEFHTSNQEKNIVYLCGLRLPLTKISDLKNSVDTIKDDLKRQITLDNDTSLKSDDFIRSIRKTPKRKRVLETVVENDGETKTTKKPASTSRRRLLDVL